MRTINQINKPLRIVPLLCASAAFLILPACGATTGGVQNALAQKAASAAIQNAMKDDETAIVTTVTTQTVAVQPLDTTAMSPKCAKVAEKMAAMDARILAANDIIKNGNSSTMAGQAAAAAASQGAVQSGAARAMSKVPFGGMFAKAAIDGMANSGKKKVAKAQKEIQKATLERAKLEGRYAGMNCGRT